MSERKISNVDGTCIISEDVIAGIACNAACEVPGVAGPAQRPITGVRSAIGSKAVKAVKIVNNERETTLDVYLNVNFGTRIQEVGSAVQSNVKQAVQSMTNTPVTKVNVHIVGVVSENGTVSAAAEQTDKQEN